MRTVMFAAAALAALSLNVTAASATDLVNEDATAYTVTVTAADGSSQTIEVAASSEIQGVCNGCDLALDGAAPVTAGADDTVAIVDGAISIQE